MKSIKSRINSKPPSTRDMRYKATPNMPEKLKSWSLLAKIAKLLKMEQRNVTAENEYNSVMVGHSVEKDKSRNKSCKYNNNQVNQVGTSVHTTAPRKEASLFKTTYE
jgi:hypothetical protein